MYKYIDCFNLKSKDEKNVYNFVIVYDDVSHTSFRVFVTSDVAIALKKNYKTNDDITKHLSFVKNYNNDYFHCVINKIY